MAKILKAGEANPDKPWIGRKLTCSHCHCEFKLESKDRVKLNYDQRDGDYYDTDCANKKCHRLITFTLPKDR